MYVCIYVAQTFSATSECVSISFCLTPAMLYNFIDFVSHYKNVFFTFLFFKFLFSCNFGCFFLLVLVLLVHSSISWLVGWLL